jgi:hypothetical protein
MMATAKIPQRLFDLKAAAQYLGRKPWGLRELVWRGELPITCSGKRGAKWFFDVADLDAFIEKGKHYELRTRGKIHERK